MARLRWVRCSLLTLVRTHGTYKFALELKLCPCANSSVHFLSCCTMAPQSGNMVQGAVLQCLEAATLGMPFEVCSVFYPYTYPCSGEVRHNSGSHVSRISTPTTRIPCHLHKVPHFKTLKVYSRWVYFLLEVGDWVRGSFGVFRDRVFFV